MKKDLIIIACHCCLILGIDCNKFTVSFPSTFYDDAPNKFYHIGLKSLSLTMEGDAIVLSHCILLIRATTFFDEYLYCTIYNIVH